jgi:hypothetical protein
MFNIQAILTMQCTLFRFYGTEVRSRELLSGNYAPPDEASSLYKALDNQEKRNAMSLEKIEKTVKRAGSISGVPIGAAASYTKSHQDMLKKKDQMLAKSSNQSKDYSSRLSSYSSKTTTVTKSKTIVSPRRLSSSPKSRPRKQGSLSRSVSDVEQDDPTVPDWDAKVYVRALYTYRGQMDCDLSFRKGDKFELITRTSDQFDWWEGKTEDGKLGIFPANYVKII